MLKVSICWIIKYKSVEKKIAIVLMNTTAIVFCIYCFEIHLLFVISSFFLPMLPIIHNTIIYSENIMSFIIEWCIRTKKTKFKKIDCYYTI